MKSFTTPALLAVLATVSTVLAAPAPAPSSVQEGNIAVRAPKPTPAPEWQMVEGAVTKMTVTIINSHTADIKTRHAVDPSRARPIKGADKEDGIIAKGDSKTYEVAKGYLGSVFVNDAQYTTNAACSQIESNLDNGWMTFDVSFVTGFSVPIVCKCGGSPGIKSGCNLDLFAAGTCPPNDFQPGINRACANPFRDTERPNKQAAPFFQACAHKGYTYVDDHEANRCNECKSGQLECCVGTACAP